MLNKAIRYYLVRYPRRTLLAALFLLLAAVLEGLSIAVVLTLMEVAIQGDSATLSAPTMIVRGALDAAGVPRTLGFMLLLIFTGMTLKSAMRWYALRHVGYAVAEVVTDQRKELLNALMAARWEHFVRQPAGHFANALGMESNIASNVYKSLASLIAAGVQVVVFAGLAFLSAWQTAAVAVVAAGLSPLLLGRLMAISRRAGRLQVVNMKSLVGRLADALGGFKAIKAMGGEWELQRFLLRETSVVNEGLRLKVLAQETLSSLQEPLMVAVMGAAMYIAVTAFQVPFSVLLVQMFIFSRIVSQANLIMSSYQTIVIGEPALWSLRKTIDKAQQQREESMSGREAPVFDREIAFRNVWFSHGDRVILRDVTVTIRAGEFIALAGVSGSGKTTFVDLVAGLLRTDRGAVEVDGRDLGALDMKAWRGALGYVAQEIGLLHESVFTNVTLGDPRFGEAEVEEALRMAGAWGFVESLENGLHTTVGERGSRLSGGQRQRIALARALVRRPRLLILDEITASLDPDSEQEICRTLATLRGTTTVLAISHQKALRGMADHVFRFSRGRVAVEAGEKQVA
jgi:ATP-binding cassette, subfamily C, bacterial